MTLGLTFLSLMSAYWWKNYILNFKTYKLDFKGHFGKKELQNLSVTKIYSVGFNHYADHDDEILCKRIKQSDWSWDGAAGFSITAGLRWYSTFIQVTKYHPIRVLPPPKKKKLHLPNFYIIITWSWRLKSKN